MNFWPFNIAAKRRAAEEAEKERKAARERSYREFLSRTPAKPRPSAVTHSPTPAKSTAVSPSSRDDSTDMSNPLHPFNPLNPMSPVSVWTSSTPTESSRSCEPAPDYGSSSCDTSSTGSYD